MLLMKNALDFKPFPAAVGARVSPRGLDFLPFNISQRGGQGKFAGATALLNYIASIRMFFIVSLRNNLATFRVFRIPARTVNAFLFAVGFIPLSNRLSRLFNVLFSPFSSIVLKAYTAMALKSVKMSIIFRKEISSGRKNLFAFCALFTGRIRHSLGFLSSLRASGRLPVATGISYCLDYSTRGAQ